MFFFAEYLQTIDWGEVRTSPHSSPHFFCEVWGEDPQFLLMQGMRWGPQFFCEVEEKSHSSLYLNSSMKSAEKVKKISVPLI